LLNRKRQEYILSNPSAESKDAMLDAAMIKTVREYAKTKNLTW
jgi:hypothetical protein